MMAGCFAVIVRLIVDATLARLIAEIVRRLTKGRANNGIVMVLLAVFGLIFSRRPWMTRL